MAELITVTSMGYAQEAVSNMNVDAVISVTSPAITPDGLFDVPHLWAPCHDIEVSKRCMGRNTIYPMAPEQLEDIIKLASEHRHVLVHCRAGMSRSPAVALGLLVASGMTSGAACAALAAACPEAMPNRWIAALIDEALAPADSLLDAVVATFDQHRRADGSAIGGDVEPYTLEAHLTT